VDIRLDVSVADKFQHLVLFKVTSKNVVIVILENLDVRVVSGWYINFVVKKKETRRV